MYWSTTLGLSKHIPFCVLINTKMSHRKCAFKNCNTSKYIYPNLHLFRFPIKDKERCKAWAERTGCPETLVRCTPKQLSARLVCALHFEQSSFMNCMCNSLNRHAVPVAGFINQDLLPMLDNLKTKDEVYRLLLQRETKMREQCSITSNKTFVSCDPEPVVSQCASSSTPCANNEQDPLGIVDDIAAEVGNQEGSADRNKDECDVTVEQRGIITTMDLVDALSKRLSGPPLTLLKMQILRSRENDSKSEWAMEEKELALTMYYKSAPFYKYMRDRQHFMLPSDADIQHWINCTKHSSF